MLLAALAVAKIALGYSWFRVESASMQRLIPEGSLIFAKRVNESEINTGDVIVYECKDKTTITHRVTKVIENHGGSEYRGFETKGVENAGNDLFIVPSLKVIGKVVYFTPGMGNVLLAAQKIIPIILAVLITLITAALLSRRSKNNSRVAPKPKVQTI